MLRIVVFIVTIISFCYCHKALNYFLSNKKIQNCSAMVIANISSCDSVWIEYKYYIENINIASKRLKKDLSVGVFENLDFDCKFSNDAFSGYTFEVMKLLQEFGFRFIYRKLNSTRNLTEPLILNEIDILACHPDIEYNLHSEIVRLSPTLQSEYVLIYNPNKLRFTKDIFILTFAGTLWICFLVLLIILAICLHFAMKQYSLLDMKYKAWTWVDITLWANAAACQQGLSHTPDGFASRLIFFLGYLISYLLYTGFAAGITSLLLQQGTSKDVTASDIAKMNIRIVTLKNHRYVASASKNETVTVASIDDIFAHINQDDVVGIVPKIFVEQYYAKKLNYNLIDTYATSKLTIAGYSRSFLMRKDSVYMMINNLLLRLQQAGLMEKILKESILSSQKNINTSKHSSAGIEHVGSAITILVIGTLSSTVFLVFELIFALYSGKL